ncbi:MAG: PHP domain-containing protein [Candidatus Bilamarchaeaceae archaeon]
MKIDFHVHTTASMDASIKPAELAKKAALFGITPAITDHNSIDSWKKMKETNTRFIPGEEIRTTSGDLIGLFLTENIPANLSPEETIERIREQGGLAYAPHMYDITRHGCGDSCAMSVDIIEIFNARCLGDLNTCAKKTAEQLKKPGAAGSDSHFLFEFGTTYTILPEIDIENPKAVLKALKGKGVKIIGKSAPIYVRGATSIFSKVRMLWRSLNGGGVCWR